MSNEFVLICGDGGIKGGFIAGAVTALFKHFPEQLGNIKIIAASSASVGSMCYLISHGLGHPGRVIWTTELSDKDFLDVSSFRSLYKEKEPYDLDHMVYRIFRDKYPLDEAKIESGEPEFYFCVQNYGNCKVEFFGNTGAKSFLRDGEEIPIHDLKKYSIYELIKAAGAAPFIYDRYIEIDGKPYMNAATLEPFTLDLPGMRGRKKIVILTKHDSSIKRRVVYWLSGMLWPIFVNPFRKRHFKSEIYRQYARKPAVLDKLFARIRPNGKDADDCLVIIPQKKIGGIFDNSLDTLRMNFEHGEQVIASELPRIRTFFS